MRLMLLDTNLVLLHIAGSCGQVSRFKRTASLFTVDDYALLTRQQTRFRGLATTPAILAEASDLLPAQTPLMHALADFAREAVELAAPAQTVVADPAFDRLGFSDVMSICVADESVEVFTGDFSLHGELASRGKHVTNFNHLRQYE
jgi:hypothetical protein